MFVAGALIWPNVGLRVREPRDVGKGTWLCDIGYGFPEFALEKTTELIPGTPIGAPSKGMSLSPKKFLEQVSPSQRFYVVNDRGLFFYPPPSGFTPSGIGIAIDVVFALAILLLAAILSEYIFRRGFKGSSRKP